MKIALLLLIVFSTLLVVAQDIPPPSCADYNGQLGPCLESSIPCAYCANSKCMDYDPCANKTKCQSFVPSHMSCADYTKDRNETTIVVGTIIFACVTALAAAGIASKCKKDMNTEWTCGIYVCVWFTVYIPMVLVLNHIQEAARWPAQFCGWIIAIFFIGGAIFTVLIVLWQIPPFVHKHFSSCRERCFGHTNSHIQNGDGNSYAKL